MNTNTLRNYRAARTAGMTASSALSTARTVESFRRAEWADLVRIRIECDNDPYDPGDCEPINEESRRRFWDRIEQLGVYGVIGEYRLSPDSDDWQHGDSIWGCAGYQRPGDWRENWYVSDIMGETLDALKDALRNRCEVCRQVSNTARRLAVAA